MSERNAAHVARRTSLVLVDEARGGAPFKAISFALAFVTLLFGLRDIFFCGTPLLPSNSADAHLASFVQDCDADKTQQFYAGMVGVGLVAVAALRVTVAIVRHVAGLYKSGIILLVVDILTCFVFFRAGQGIVPMYYILPLTVVPLCYEAWVLVVARQMHLKRMKKKGEAKEG